MNQVLDELGISLDHELSEVTPGLEKPHITQVGKVRGHPPCELLYLPEENNYYHCYIICFSLSLSLTH